MEELIQNIACSLPPYWPLMLKIEVIAKETKLSEHLVRIILTGE